MSSRKDQIPQKHTNEEIDTLLDLTNEEIYTLFDQFSDNLFRLGGDFKTLEEYAALEGDCARKEVAHMNEVIEWRIKKGLRLKKNIKNIKYLPPEHINSLTNIIVWYRDYLEAKAVKWNEHKTELLDLLELDYVNVKPPKMK